MGFISVIIPTYNRANKISKAIQSILNQSFKDFEIIIMDDNSQDNTKEIVLSFNDERIKYYKNINNLGQIKNMQEGVQKAQNEWIIFLSDDDYYENNNSFMLAYELSQNDIQAIFIEHCIDNGIFKVDNFTKDIPPIVNAKELLLKYPWEILNIIIKKEFFLNLNLYSKQTFFADFEAFDLICMNSNTVGYLKDFKIVFEIGEDNLNKFKINIKDFVMSLLYLRRPYLNAIENKFLSKVELDQIYNSRFEKYNLNIVASIVGENYKDILSEVHNFLLNNIQKNDVLYYLEEFANILENSYQKEIDEKVKEYKKHLQKLLHSKEKITNSKRIIIYGTGQMAKEIYKVINDKVIAFIDDFNSKDNFLGKPLIKKNELSNFKYDGIILATNKFNFIKQMEKDLDKDKVIYVY